MIDAELHDKIEKYLLDKLNTEETEQIEIHIAQNPALKEQVELQRMTLFGLQQLSSEHLYRKFAEWDAELDAGHTSLPPISSPSFFTKINVSLWATAVLLVLLLLVFTRYFQQSQKARQTATQDIARLDSTILHLQEQNQKKEAIIFALLDAAQIRNDSIIQQKNNHKHIDSGAIRRAASKPALSKSQQIAIQYAPPYDDNSPLRRGGINSADPLFAQADALMKNQNYSAAAELLKLIPEDDPRQAQVQRVLPFALFYSHDFKAATPAFENLIKIDIFLKMQAQWHLLLCYIAEREDDRAQKLLHEILQKSEHEFFEAAEKLKEELNYR